MKVIVKGHQRAGNNYLMNLLSANFFDNCDITEFSDGNDHCILNFPNKEYRYLYIYRNMDAVLNSIFNIRYIYGLNIFDYDIFLKTKYSEMYDTSISTSISLVTKRSNIWVTDNFPKIQSPFFCNIQYTPVEWYILHLQKYEELKNQNDNIIFISYDLLKTDFENEMEKIRVFISMPKFKNIGCKVGWFQI